jgi:hypothetical protein
MAHKILQKWDVEDGGGLEFLACDGRADNGKNAGADDRADAERCEAQPAERLFQPEFGAFAIGNELINVLSTEKD